MIFKNNNGSYVCVECGSKFDSKEQGEAHLVRHYKFCCKKHDNLEDAWNGQCGISGMGPSKRASVCCDNCSNL